VRGLRHGESRPVFTGASGTAVRLVAEQENQHRSQWESITSVAEKTGYSAGTLRRWRRQVERDAGARWSVSEPATRRRRPRPWRPGSHKTVSGEAGAVHA
jgi:transposase-like protein